MSAAMLKQFLEEAKEYIKQEKYQEALDASSRVTSFDPNNFQALICAGKANFHLQQVSIDGFLLLLLLLMFYYF
jgi:hypothetical protein